MRTYERVKNAKRNIKTANRLGWPDSEEQILTLCEEMDETEQKVLRIGRFVKNWRGWVFQMPSTSEAVRIIENGEPIRSDILFVVDEEG